MNKILFVESSLEIVPQQIQSQPAVKKHAARRNKHPNELLLDYSSHWQAMGNLEHKEKRGRPDIVHDVLKLAFDSNLGLEVRMHTINDHVITFASDWRIPRNYNQFVGLMEKLLLEKEIKDDKGKTLLKIEKQKLEEILKEEKKVIVLNPKGKETDLKGLAKLLSNEDCLIVIGAFPHGDFLHSELLAKYDNVALGTKELTALAVTYRVLAAIELGK